MDASTAKRSVMSGQNQMKKKLQFLTIVFFAFLLKVTGQSNPSEGKIQFTKSTYEFMLIDSVKGCDKNCLYGKAKNFMISSFKSAKDVIEMDDKEMGRIVGKGSIKRPVENNFGQVISYDYIHFKITIDVKDSKFRITLTDITHEAGNYTGACNGGSLSNEKVSCGLMGMGKKYWNIIKSDTQTELNTLLISFQKSAKDTSKTSDF